MASRGGFFSLRSSVEREINHHDRVFLHDADQQDDSDERDHAEFSSGHQQRENRAGSGRRQRRENRDRMNVTFIKNAQDDVTVTIAARMSSGSFASEAMNACAVP